MTATLRLHDSLLGEHAVTALFAAPTHLQFMLDVEAALADAEAAVGVIPEQCVTSIRAAAHAELYDLEALAAEAAQAGNVVIPMVRHLTARVRDHDADAARYVHWGATSQDILDTALVLQLQASVPIIIEHVRRAAAAAAGLTRRYADTPMAGRTWLQQATPTTFGLKAAGWLDGLTRTQEHLATELEGVRVLQLGGAAGTLASLGARGWAVTEALAERLGLHVADTPWHAQRDRLGTLAGVLGVAAVSGGKIARDVSLMAQTEVGEVSEARQEGRGGSSTMPQKQNPVASSVALAAAHRAPGLVATVLGAMVQEHERGLGGWQAEWDAVPDLVVVTAGGTKAVADALSGLVVSSSRMRANTHAAGGTLMAESLAMALAEFVGKAGSHEIIEASSHRALAEGRSLAEILAEDPAVTEHVSPAEITRLLTPDQYLGSTQTFITRVLARYDRSAR